MTLDLNQIAEQLISLKAQAIIPVFFSSWHNMLQWLATNNYNPSGYAISKLDIQSELAYDLFVSNHTTQDLVCQMYAGWFEVYTEAKYPAQRDNSRCTANGVILRYHDGHYTLHIQGESNILTLDQLKELSKLAHNL